MTGTGTHGVLNLVADTTQRCAQLAVTCFKRAVDGRKISVEFFGQLIPLGIADKRAVQRQNLGLAAVFVQHIFKIPEPRLQAHHSEFTQGINRRVCHLREILAEEMRQRAVHFGQHGRGRIVAHRSQRFFAILGHWRKDLLQFFDCVPCRDLATTQRITREQRCFGHVA